MPGWAHGEDCAGDGTDLPLRLGPAWRAEQEGEPRAPASPLGRRHPQPVSRDSPAAGSRAVRVRLHPRGSMVRGSVVRGSVVRGSVVGAPW